MTVSPTPGRAPVPAAVVLAFKVGDKVKLARRSVKYTHLHFYVGGTGTVHSIMAEEIEPTTPIVINRDDKGGFLTVEAQDLEKV
jgi:hypothetical protein